MPEIPLGFCQCGCGRHTSIIKENVATRGLVKGSYQRFVTGHGNRKPHEFTVDENGCWLWGGSVANSTGYGWMTVDGRGYLAHRWHYEQARGPIPEGLQLDHLCRVRCCVNPAHLEPVTVAENLRRGDGTKLTATQVREIVRSAKPTRVLMERYGVSRETINGIRRGKSWCDIYLSVGGRVVAERACRGCGTVLSVDCHPNRRWCSHACYREKRLEREALERKAAVKP